MHVVEFVADASSGGTGLFLDDPRTSMPNHASLSRECMRSSR